MKVEVHDGHYCDTRVRGAEPDVGPVGMMSEVREEKKVEMYEF